MSSSGKYTPTLLLPNQGSVPSAPPSGNVLLYAANGEPMVLDTASIQGTPLFRGIKNWLRNGSTMLWSVGQAQRTAPTTPVRITTPSVATYHADGYFTQPYGASLQTTAAGEIVAGNFKTPGAVQIQGMGGSLGYKFGQRLSAATTAALAGSGRYYTFSGFIYNESGVAFTPIIQINVANGSDNFAGVTNRQAANGSTLAAATTTRFSMTFLPSSFAGVGQGLEFVIWVPEAAATQGWIRMGGFQVNEGGHALELEILPRELEITRSLAWLSHSYGAGVTPGASSHASLCQVVCDGTNNNQIAGQKFPMPMARTPDVAIYSDNGTLGRVSDVSYNDSGPTGVVAGDPSLSGFRCVLATGGTYTLSQSYTYHYQASCELL